MVIFINIIKNEVFINMMDDNVQKYSKLIKRLLKVMKPNGVSEIEFTLEPLSIRDDEKEFYMSVTYVVPDDSEFLVRARDMRASIMNDPRRQWSSELKKTIQDYFDIKVLINSSGIRSESYHNKLKNY